MVTMGNEGRKLSNDLLNQARMISGHHSIDSGICTREIIGILDGDQRRVLGLLEALDYDCFEYNCLNIGTNTIEDVKHYLIQHKAVVQSLLPITPSALGLFAGTFDFLYDKGEKE